MGKKNKAEKNIESEKQAQEAIENKIDFYDGFSPSSDKNIPFPAPNKYSINDKFNSKRPKSPTWKIGTGKRPPLYMNNKTPGVGIYSLRKSQNDAPRYSFRWKYTIKDKEKRPGVGQYNVSESSQITMKKEPAWKIGTASKKFEVKKEKENPGPGMYSIPCSMVDVNDYTREKGNFDKNFRYV